jgi:hypothetical protein
MNKTNFITLVAGAILGSVVVAGAWTEAPANPPADNVAAPINVGVDNQTKLGSLILNASTVSPDQYGLDVFGESRFFGKIMTDTDVCIENAAGVTCLSDIAGLGPTYGLDTTSTCTLYYDSMKDIGVKARPGYESPAQPIPDSCFSPTGCTVKQEIWNAKGIYKLSYITYAQDKDDGAWTSTHNRGYGLKNGNTASHNVLPHAGGKDYGYILTRDDAPNQNNVGSNAGTKYVELDKDRWSFYDTLSTYGQKVYFCSGSVNLSETPAS